MFYFFLQYFHNSSDIYSLDTNYILTTVTVKQTAIYIDMKMIPYVKKYLTEYYEFILTSATSKKEEKQ